MRCTFGQFDMNDNCDACDIERRALCANHELEKIVRSKEVSNITCPKNHEIGNDYNNYADCLSTKTCNDSTNYRCRIKFFDIERINK